MSEEIVNRVQKSGLVTIDLDDIELPKNILEIDIKCWLHEGLFLKEKEFRASVLSHDSYMGLYVSFFSIRKSNKQSNNWH